VHLCRCVRSPVAAVSLANGWRVSTSRPQRLPRLTVVWRVSCTNPCTHPVHDVRARRRLSEGGAKFLLCPNDVTRAGGLAAVAEFDRLGRPAFLKATGFRPAQAYFLDYDGKLYDSKAIAGYAHGVSTGVPLTPGDVSGGDKTVAHRLEMLGFKVLHIIHNFLAIQFPLLHPGAPVPGTAT
jgi:hypothetical protein